MYAIALRRSWQRENNRFACRIAVEIREPEGMDSLLSPAWDGENGAMTKPHPRAEMPMELRHRPREGGG
jgi:hypothetical protein